VRSGTEWRRSIAIPWLAYLAVTVFAPALNGAARQREFWEHAAITVAVSTVLAALWLACSRIRRPRAHASAAKR